ncbi:hypothetical protein FK535_20195 [Mycolicibacterium sp. 018/SC-01/001]|uniref:hypothetical protein n=1 Tax=Mycolicibacterium sp. 018/SC-01/001 TaxID=2592069 RepID=UPI00117CB8C1|nr:hypothetical protein [Mycolicibacterium sp. 018/SC-01/001]TRW79997.1 hypothetical protein FK535_20195 [Mycolicibacterium sp. 018/SC-01/001]
MDADADTLRTYCTLDRIDHVDTHLLPDTRDRTPEQWAREILEGPPAATRALLLAGWTMLGLRVHHRGPGAIAGWPIIHRDSEHVLLQGDSPLGLTGQLVTRVTEDGVQFAAFVRLANPAARALWARALPTHLKFVDSLLRGAAERTG